ncbi:SusC/RagA family TonB-linked outer membrane protein [Seonamhaeicola sp. MEBiC1930]|uniref:SusC/RagA family TonB-linked outer membrane protein n=1 Tax=Seonamhaeicola sp. MEBiC01930 TaxID=2976768 RepID=UPI0032446042
MNVKSNYLLALLLLFNVTMVFAQERTISGSVSDIAELPLPGTTVLVKGTTNGVSTDFDGIYSITANEGEILVFSFVGYKTQEIKIGASNTINVTMQEDASVLQEVVITALGLSKEERALGYSAQSLKSDVITEGGQSNLVNALNGKVAGVNITSSNGAPGSSANIVIRGSSSISGSNQPLFVVDGLPISNNTDNGSQLGVLDGTTFEDYGETVGTNRAADIDPNDIESVTVLKGGAATAIYGSRAVNGAIIITTKKGKAGNGLNVTFSTSYSIEKVNKYPSFQYQYGRGRSGDYSNVTHWSWGPAYDDNPTFPAGTNTDLDGDGVAEDVSGQAIPIFRDNYKNFWDEGHTLQTSVSVSGGDEKGNFYASIGRQDQEGIVQNSEYERINATIKGEYNITDKFKVGGYATYANSRTVSIQGGDTGFAGIGYYHHMWDITTRQWKDAEGNRTWFSSTVAEPQWVVNEELENDEVNRFIGSVNFSYDFADWLKLSYRVGMDTYADDRNLVRPISSVNTTNNAGDLYEIRVNNKDFNSDVLLTGKVNLMDDLGVSYLIGNNIYESLYDRLYVRGDGLSVRGFTDISNGIAITSNNITNRKRTIGVFGELSFDYQNTYFLSVTGRNDWSSTLPEGANSFFYPSISGAIVVSELLNDIGWLSFAKIKGSWAELGNDSQGLYATSDVYAKRDPNVLGNPKFTVSNVQGNPNIKPEISSTWEVGTELKFLDNLINIDFTYYNRTTEDQVVQVPLSSTTGYAAYYDNAGKVVNKGVEAILSFNNIIRNSENLNWDLLFNFTKNESEVISIPDGLDEIIIGYGYFNGANIVARPGLPYGTFVGVGYKRNDDSVLLLDDEGYPQLATENLVLGDPNPDWVLNINNSISYKGFTLSAIMEFKKGGQILNDSEANFKFYGLSKSTEDRYYSADQPNGNATAVFDGIIESTGLQSDVAAPLTNDYYQSLNALVDEANIEDASWVRLRNISLSYEVPKTWLKNTGIYGLDVTLNGRNLWLDTKYKGVDPETNALGAGNVQGVDFVNAPGTKSYGVAVRVKF